MRHGISPDMEIKTLTLRIKQLIVSQLIAEECFASPRISVEIMYRPELMARQLTACLKVPADVLQEDRIIDYYPDGLWQHIRSKLGLKYRRKEVRLTEWLVYPSVEVPDEFRDTVRLYVAPKITYYVDGGEA